MYNWYRFGWLSTNATGWALSEVNAIKTALVYTDSEILEIVIKNHPALIAIDAPLGLPRKTAFFRKAGR